jgi:glycoside/pentoside/hexuronide:cation symporter, GPH family
MKTDEHRTAEKDKIPFLEKLFYGVGSGSYQLSGDGVKSLANPIYNITLGLSPSLIGLVLMISRIFDAFTDPLVGRWSDNARTRWGRRRPFIFVGSFLTAAAFVMIWMVPGSWAGQTQPLFIYYLCAMMVFYFCATIQVVPYHTLGMEMTADYDERTSISGYKMVFSFAFQLLLPWVFRLAQSDSFSGGTMEGMRYLSYLLAGVIIAGGVLPAIFVKERYYKVARSQAKIPFWVSARQTLANRQFLVLTGVILVSSYGPGMVGSLAPYIIYYHMYGGDTKAGAEMAAIGANVFSVSAILFTPLIVRWSSRWGKVRVLQAMVWLGIFNSVMTLVLFSPQAPWLVVVYFFLQAPTAGFWVVTNSMKADICDDDELRHGTRREGMFGAVGGWIGKVGLSLTYLFSGLILDGTGFKVDLKGDQPPDTLWEMRLLFAAVPIITALLSLYFLRKYTLDRTRMGEIRRELEARRSSI